MKEVETIIIGGGLAGLGCAKKLNDERKKNFLVLTEDITGSVPERRHKVNYGAYYVQGDYQHVLPYVKIRKKIRFKEMRFLEGENKRSFLNPENFLHFVGLIKAFLLLRKFQKHHTNFKKECEHLSQKEALEKDPFLLRLYQQNATKTIRNLKLDYWADNFFKQWSWAIALTSTNNISSFYALMGLSTILTGWYEFDYYPEKLIAGFEDKIITTSVTNIERRNNAWLVSDSKGNIYTARSVVLAVPIHIARKLIHINEETNPAINSHMIHLEGTLRNEYQGSHYLLLDPEEDSSVIAKQEDGTFISYSKTDDHDLEKYFENYNVVGEKEWTPAFFIGPHALEANRGDNLYLIGGHNIALMEHAFITGIYAAYKILGETKTNL